MSVTPVIGRDLVLQRAGRILLSIPYIELAAEHPQTYPTTKSTAGNTVESNVLTAASSACCTIIVGPNGAGKSVLVRCLCDLLAPDAGTVTWGGYAPDYKRRRRVGLILQKPVLLKRSAQANLVYALRQTGLDRKQAQANSDAALEEAGLGNIRHVLAHRLSGGEQQRLALVRALLLKPHILFLDEVTANVDPASTLMIEQQLRTALADGLNVVMVSHDPGQVKRLADHVVLIHKGELVESATASQFFEQPSSPLSRHWLAGELLV